MGEKGKKRTSFLLCRVFGWRVYLSKVRMAQKPRCDGLRKSLRYNNWLRAGKCCQECGREIELVRTMSMHSFLDTSHRIEERYSPENCFLLCKECNRIYQKLKLNDAWQASEMRRRLKNISSNMA